MMFRTGFLIWCGLIITVYGIEIIRLAKKDKEIIEDPRLVRMVENAKDLHFTASRKANELTTLNENVNNLLHDFVRCEKNIDDLGLILNNIKRTYNEGHKDRLRLAKRQFIGEAPWLYNPVVNEMAESLAEDWMKSQGVARKKHGKTDKKENKRNAKRSQINGNNETEVYIKRTDGKNEVHENTKKSELKEDKDKTKEKKDEKKEKKDEKKETKDEKKDEKGDKKTVGNRSVRSLVDALIEVIRHAQDMSIKAVTTTPAPEGSSVNPPSLDSKEEEKIDSFIKAIEESERKNKYYKGYWLTSTEAPTPAPAEASTAAREKRNFREKPIKPTKSKPDSHARRSKRQQPEGDEKEPKANEKWNKQPFSDDEQADELASQNTQGSSDTDQPGEATCTSKTDEEDESDKQVVVISKPPDLSLKNKAELFREMMAKKEALPPPLPVVIAQKPEFLKEETKNAPKV